jgi:hypothetical protein
MCQLDKLGAELQRSLVDGVKIQVECHSVLDHPHVDHETGLCAAVAITDSQDWSFLECMEDIRCLTDFRSTNVQQMATEELVVGVQPFDGNLTIMDRFGRKVIYLQTEGVISHDAKNMCGLMVRKGC